MSIEINKGSIPIEIIRSLPEYLTRQNFEDLYPKRKYACCLAYFGTSYQGLQMNPDCNSIEAQLEKALFLAGCFNENNYGHLQKLQWTRAARTDRGVHALGQCCSMKLHFPFEFLEKEKAIERVNELLPLDIRLLAVTKVTKAFNSHTNCSNRRYCYLLPTYTLLDVIEMNTLLHGAYINQGPIIDCARMGGFAEPGSTKYLGFDSLKSVRKNLADYRVTSEKLELFRRALDFFVGTKSYHNFTTGKESEDDSAKRYITECICSDPFNSNSFPSLSNKLPLVSNYDECDSNDNKNIEWVCITVSGQSFLLNQIRKMVGFAVDIARGVIDYSITVDVINPNVKMEVAMAPALGLYLDELYFTQYNIKQSRDQERRIKDVEIAKSREIIKSKAMQQQLAIEETKKRAVEAVKQALLIVSNSPRTTEDLEVKETISEQKRIKLDYSESIDTQTSTASQSLGQFEFKIGVSNEEVVSNSALDNVSCSKYSLDKRTEEEGGDSIGGEQILWWTASPIKERIAEFRNKKLWPHIIQQEALSLNFMFYLDFLRTRYCYYINKKSI